MCVCVNALYKKFSPPNEPIFVLLGATLPLLRMHAIAKIPGFISHFVDICCIN